MTDQHQIETTALEPSTLSHSDTHFVLHNDPHIDKTPASADHTLTLSDDLDNSVMQDYPIVGISWSSAQAKNTVLINSRPINAFMNVTTIKDRCSHRRGMKGTFELTIKINSPGACRGALLFELYPSAFSNPRSTYVDMHTYTQYQLTHTAIFDASNPHDICFKLPPHHVEPYMELNSNCGKHWRLYCTVIAPLTSTVNATAISAGVRVYCRAGQHQFIGLVPESYSGALKTMSKSISENKYFGKATEFASSMTKAAGDLADLFGYSKPINHDIHLMQPTNGRVLTTDGPDYAEVVTMFSYNHVSPIIKEDDKEDPLSIASITSHDTLVYRGVLTDGVPIRIPVCPGNYPTNASGPSGLIMTCDMFCLMPFRYYRVEKFIYTLRIFSSPNVRGDIYIYFIPTVDLTDVYNATWDVNAKKMVVSLQGSSCTEIVVNWNANARVLPNLALTTGAAAPTDATFPSNGMLFIYPGQISTPNGAASIDFDLTYRSEGLQPMELSKSWYGDPTLDFNQAVAPSTVVNESKLTDLEVCTKTIINQESPYDVGSELSGDPIKSLRALAQRPSMMQRFLIYFDTEDPTPGNYWLYRFFLPRNAQTALAGRTDADSSDLEEFTTYAAWVTSAFVGYKGSTRHTVRSEKTLVHFSNGVTDTFFPMQLPCMIIPTTNNAGGAISQEFLLWPDDPYKTLASEDPFRVSYPYNQPFDYFPSCWTRRSVDLEFDYFSVQPYASLHVKGEFNATNSLSIKNTTLNVQVYTSAGNDLSVFMWRGVPLYTATA